MFQSRRVDNLKFQKTTVRNYLKSSFKLNYQNALLKFIHIL